MRRAALLALPLAAAVSACDVGMDRQAKYNPQAPAALFSDGAEQQAPPEGAVAVDRPAALAAMATPSPVTPAVLARGRQRFEIFCQPCHGGGGNGDGTVVQRGFPHPPAYAEPRLLAAPASHLFDVISNGYGIMYPYGDRLTPADRWAVVAYVRALQVAQAGTDGRGPGAATGGGR